MYQGAPPLIAAHSPMQVAAVQLFASLPTIAPPGHVVGRPQHVPVTGVMHSASDFASRLQLVVAGHATAGVVEHGSASLPVHAPFFQMLAPCVAATLAFQ